MIDFFEKIVEGWELVLSGVSDYDRLHDDYIVNLFDGITNV